MKFFFLRYKTISLFCLLFVALNSSAQELEKISLFGSNPGNLNMHVYVPSSELKNVPLVVVLHGCNQNAKTIAAESGWNQLAKKNDFIVIYPEQKMFNNGSRCFNWFNPNDTEHQKGELESIMQMIRYSVKNYSVDSNRIFIYGLSAGAMMSVAAGTVYPHQFKGVVVFSGGPYKAAENPIDALQVMRNSSKESVQELVTKAKKEKQSKTDKYPLLIVLHGKKDNVNTIANSNKLIAQWLLLQQADTIADKTELKFEGAELTRKIYTKGAHECVIYYEFETSGHWLPIDPGVAEKQGGKAGLFSKDDNFFSTYWIAKDLGLLKHQ